MGIRQAQLYSYVESQRITPLREKTSGRCGVATVRGSGGLNALHYVPPGDISATYSTRATRPPQPMESAMRYHPMISSRCLSLVAPCGLLRNRLSGGEMVQQVQPLDCAQTGPPRPTVIHSGRQSMDVEYSALNGKKKNLRS